MILVVRGAADSLGAESLASIEAVELARVRTLGHAPSADEIGDRYRIAAELLWQRQSHKCAYCENVEQRKRNDVEHFRPKARADRSPGSVQTHGYWWLAWRWENLFFSCRNCNQASAGGAGKLDKFPLEVTSGVLEPEQDPNGADAGVERPLLIDPARESGVDHIEFVRRSEAGRRRWIPVPRARSARGAKMIECCVLDRDDLLDLYEEHVEHQVQPRANAVDEVLADPYASEAKRSSCWQRCQSELYRAGMPFVGLSYDALRVMVTDEELAEHGLTRRKPL